MLNPITDILKTNPETLSMPPDPSQWSNIVLQTITEKFPETSPYIMDLVFIKADENNALGYATIMSEDNKVDIPVIIRNRKLLPLDLMILDRKLTYANPSRLYDALQGNKLFSGLSGIPAQPDIGGAALSQQSASRALLEKVSSLTNRTKLLKIAKILNQNKKEVDILRAKYPAFNDVINILESKVFPDINKVAYVLENSIDKPVIQIKKDPDTPGKFTVIMNSQKIWNPVKIEGDYNLLHKIAEKYGIDTKKFIKFANTKQTLVLNFGKTHQVKIANIEFTSAEPGDNIITYSPERKLKIEGKVLEYKDLDKNGWISKGYVFISDKWFDISFDTPFAALAKNKKSVKLKESQIALPNRYYFLVINDKYAMGPWKVVNKVIRKYDSNYHYDINFDGLDKRYEVNISSDDDNRIRHVNIEAEDLNGNEISKTINNIKSLKLVEVGKKVDITKYDNIKQASKDICNELGANIIKFHKNSQTFSIKGPYLNRMIKGASIYNETINFDMENLDYDDALFILSHQYKPRDAVELLKLATNKEKIYIVNFGLPETPINTIIKNSSQKAKDLLNKFENLIMPWKLIKIAVELNNNAALDSIFSLSLSSPENMSYLIEGIPILEETESILAKYLLMSRLGGIDYPEDELKLLLDEYDKFLSYVKELKFSYK